MPFDHLVIFFKHATAVRNTESGNSNIIGGGLRITLGVGPQLSSNGINYVILGLRRIHTEFQEASDDT